MSAPADQHRPVVYAGPPPSSAHHPRPTSSANGLRAVGVGVIGLIAGLFAGWVIQDLIGIAFVIGGGGLPLEVGVLTGMLMPLTAVAGVVGAVLIDRHSARRRRVGAGPRDFGTPGE